MPSRAKVSTQTVPAPVGGWNTRDALSAMPPIDAVEMINWIPRPGAVETRKGHSEHATGVGSGNVETLMSYEGETGTDLLASSSTNIYDASATGAATSLASGFTDGRWSWANFNDEMGLVNGSDAPQVYNGTTIAAMTISGSGLTPSNLDGIAVFKNRSYFWDSSTQDFWYSAIDTLGGTLTLFPLSRVSRLGGRLIAVESLSTSGSGGESIEDLLAFVMSSGEVLIYAGTDPSASTTWALAGIYRIGRPVGDRPTQRVDGDVYVITDQDYVSLSEAVRKSGRTRPSKLSGAAQTAVTNFRGNTGWEVVYHPSEEALLFVNVPVSANRYDQHVLNLETGGACKFEGLNGRSWVTHNGALYFGTTDGRVMQALDGLDDDGSNVTSRFQQASTNLGVNADKAITATRPVLSALGTVQYGLGYSMDYRPTSVEQIVSTSGGGTPWGSPWGSPWSASTNVRDDWRVGGYFGNVISAIITFTTQNQQASFLRTDYEFERARR